jgi:hypothetical protein
VSHSTTHAGASATGASVLKSYIVSRWRELTVGTTKPPVLRTSMWGQFAILIITNIYASGYPIVAVLAAICPTCCDSERFGQHETLARQFLQCSAAFRPVNVDDKQPEALPVARPSCRADIALPTLQGVSHGCLQSSAISSPEVVCLPLQPEQRPASASSSLDFSCKRT